jgi:ankyrin repeat protein
MKTKINDGVATLMKAAMEGDTAQAQQMIRDGADVNARDDSGRTALMIAASNGHTYIVQLLLDSGADPAARDKQNMTALLSAEAKGFARTASLLKDSTLMNAPPRCKNLSNTPLTRETRSVSRL